MGIDNMFPCETSAGLYHTGLAPRDSRLTRRWRDDVRRRGGGRLPFGAAALPGPYLATLVAEQSYLRVSGISSAGT